MEEVIDEDGGRMLRHVVLFIQSPSMSDAKVRVEMIKKRNMESQDAWKSWSQARVEERSPLASPGMMSVQ